MQSSYFLNLEYIYNWLLHLTAGAPAWLVLTLAIIYFILAAAIPLLGLGIVYALGQTGRIHRATRGQLVAEEVKVSAVMSPRRDEAWERVEQYLASDNPAEWKLAIIEADNLLDGMVRKMNYPGDNLGERLKAIEPADFATLGDAWEAHKVRNQIAHQRDFQLTRREAERVIRLFKGVFSEFHLI